MSFRGKKAPPGYVPGLGRGAAGFTTRSDVGSAVAAPSAAAGEGELVGSRSAEARAALKRATATTSGAPANYVAGAGRGAGNFETAPTELQQSMAPRNDGRFDDAYDEDDEADRIWAAIDERMANRRRKKRKGTSVQEENVVAVDDPDDNGRTKARARIQSQFSELKMEMAAVSESEWLAIPDAMGDKALRHKNKRNASNEVFTPLSDSLLEQRSMINRDATASSSAVGGNAAVDVDPTGVPSVRNMSGLSAARGTVLGLSLDRMSDAVGGQTVVDPQGYLTSMAASSGTTTAGLATVGGGVNAEVADIHKARLLLKSVRDTNPHHGPGWIAAARVEEAAGKILAARKIIQEGCRTCPQHEDVWLEAARLHPPEVAKSILATAVRRLPHSVKLFLRAADLEQPYVVKQRAVLRKALEVNSTSVTLWKAAVELENAENARVLLSVAVEKVTQSVDLWLALARLESYENAKEVLNRARKFLPTGKCLFPAIDVPSAILHSLSIMRYSLFIVDFA
jgi:pre-mRNA-processing factor 6